MTPRPPTPPPLPPEENEGRRAFLRVLLVAAVAPVLFAAEKHLPVDRQDLVLGTALGLVVLVPTLAVLVGLVTYLREERQAGVGYAVGGCVAAVVGFGACVFAMAGSL